MSKISPEELYSGPQPMREYNRQLMAEKDAQIVALKKEIQEAREWSIVNGTQVAPPNVELLKEEINRLMIQVQRLTTGEDKPEYVKELETDLRRCISAIENKLTIHPDAKPDNWLQRIKNKLK